MANNTKQNFNKDNTVGISGFGGGMASLVEILGAKEVKKSEAHSAKNSQVFLVHGRDEGLKHEIARVLKDQDIEPIILDEQLNGGSEILIKKFEENSNVGAAICLFTADDCGKLQDKYSEKEKTQNDYQPRARQNVVFETGFFMAKLGRENVIIIADKGIEFPSDIRSILYTNSGKWCVDMLSELDGMGYEIDLNKLKKKKTQ